MLIVRDDELVQRRRKIGQIASLTGLVILIGGMAFTWLAPNWNIPVQYAVYVPFLALLVGFILSNIGVYHTNRWGRSPRPDEQLDQSLKGMSRDYKLYHFALPVPHLLLTPGGLVALVTKIESGEFTVDGDKWKQKFNAGKILRFFGQEGLGNPTKEAQYQLSQMERFLEKQDPDLPEIPMEAVVVFLSDKVVLNVSETDVPILRASKLKGYFRSQSVKPLPADVQRRLQAVLDQAAGCERLGVDHEHRPARLVEHRPGDVGQNHPI